MHMANELLSVPVAGGTLAIAGLWLGWICRKAKSIVKTEQLALMGILGAFIFAGQMVNFRLPAMPGTSGHLVGTVMLAIILGPHLAAIAMAAVVIIQCLIFQDGGLLALGCNVINMALVPAYLGYWLYKGFTAGEYNAVRTYTGTMLACIGTLIVGAILVTLQVAISGVLRVPYATFLITMIGVHFLVGFVEGLITLAVLAFLQQVRGDLISEHLKGRVKMSRTGVLASFIIFTLIVGAGLSLLASGMPDGLEWSYAERPDDPTFESYIENNDTTIAATDEFHEKYSLMPDYSKRTAPLGSTANEETSSAEGWTSVAGIVGSAMTMFVIWLVAVVLRKKEHSTAV